MIKPSEIEKEIKAVKALNAIKVPLIKTVIITSIVVSGYFVYKDFVVPLLTIPGKISQIERTINSYTESNKADSVLYGKIDSLTSDVSKINENIHSLRRDNVETKQYMRVIKEEFPQMSKRFDDIEKVMEANSDEKKKKEPNLSRIN